MESEAAYDSLIQKIQPTFIAITKGYTNADHQKRAAKLAGAQLRYVTGLIGNHSTTRILKMHEN